MCQTVKDYVAEKVKQIEIQMASNCLKNGIPVDIVAKSIPSLSHEFIVGLSKKILRTDDT